MSVNTDLHGVCESFALRSTPPNQAKTKSLQVSSSSDVAVYLVCLVRLVVTRRSGRLFVLRNSTSLLPAENNKEIDTTADSRKWRMRE